MKVACAVPSFGAHPVLRAELLAAYPDAKFVEPGQYLNEDELIQWLADRDGLICGKDHPITERLLDALPRLKVISNFGVGTNHLDFELLQRRGILFGYTPGVNKRSVAELALCFAISGLRGISEMNAAMRAGERPHHNLGRLLTGRVVGIHGCGHIGKDFARLLQPFGCTILACDIVDQGDFYRAHGITPVGFDELIERSEVISLHLPVTPLTRNLYSREVLKRLRPRCLLINTCRGYIVDEAALRDLLIDGTLFAACFDAFIEEPATDDRLLGLRNFLSTPHIGASAEESRVAMGRASIRGLSENSVPDPRDFP